MGRNIAGDYCPMKKLPAHIRSSRLRALYLLGLVSVLSSRATPHDDFLAAKHTATEANFRNDQAALHAAITAFDALSADATLGPRARYHAAWTEWMLAAS